MQERDFKDTTTAAIEEAAPDIITSRTAKPTTAAPSATDGAGGAGTAGPPHEAVPAVGAQLVNPFVAFRQRNASGGFFKGPLIKCNYRSGEWARVRGEDETPIDPGERFVVNPHELVDTWTKLVEGKVVEPRKVYRTIDGQFAPEREALGDMDERKWPWDRSGRKRLDPWLRAVYLPMKGSDGEVCAFRATGQGAIAEIAEFVGMYASADRHGKFPVIQPDSRNFESSHGNVIFVPILRLVGWEFWEPDTPAPPVPLVPIPSAPSAAAAKPAAITARRAKGRVGDLDAAADDDMNDEVPFN